MAPARIRVRVGAILLPVLGTAFGACDRTTDGVGDRVLELAHDTIDLPADVQLHEVTVSRTQQEFEPAAIEAAVGDVVRFRAADNAGHSVQFGGPGLAAGAREHLDRTGQLRGPPLIAEGAAWIISLADAPPGDYPFHCATHPGTRGTITVRAP